MANTIKILNSGVSSATPNSLEYGEIAINYSDGKLFYKNASSAIVGSALISDNYVATLTAGTGVTISGGIGLGSSPTISIGQDVGTTADVTFNTVTGTNGLTTLTTVGQPSSTPSDGTLAVDVTNNILYFMSGSVWQPVTAGGSGASVTSTETPPSSPSAGDLWFETDTGNLFIYYNDGSSSQWVDIGGSNVANISVSDSAPSGPVNGDLWFETDTARTFVYYNDGTTSQWVEIGSTAVSAAGIDGSIQFASNSTLAATPNFIWDDTNKRLGINNATPSYSLDVTGSARITAGVIADLTGNADTASALQTSRTIELTGDVTGSVSFDGSANVQISTTVANLTSNLNDLNDVDAASPSNGDFLRFDGVNWINDAVNLSTDTIGDYVGYLVAGTGVTLTNNSGEGATPTIEIGQDVSTTANVTFNSVNAEFTGGLTGDVYASDGTSKVLENGTNGTDATFTGDVTGDVTGTVSDISNHNLGDLGDVNFTIVSPATGDIVYFDGAEWINQPGSLDVSTDVNIFSAQDGDYLRYNGSEWVNDPINLGADTVGDYVKSLVAGTGVTLADNSGESATPSISIGQDVATTSNVTFNNLILTGDLTVSGTTTQINTTELLVEDNVVVLNTGSSATPSTNAGLEVERGDFSNVSIIWNETSDTWQFTNDGSTFYNLIVDDSFTLGSTTIQLGSTVTTVTGLSSVTSTSFVGDLTGNASTASSLQTSRTIELTGDVTGLVSFDGSADVQIATIVAPDSVALGADTTGDYVESLVAGLGVTISNNSGEGATPNIAIGQDVATTSDVTFNTVTGTNGLITLTTAGVPTSSLADGAIAIDTNNNILYFRSGSTWQQVSGGVEIGDAPPSSANEGDLWWESDTGRLKVYYNDGSSSQWVDAFTSGAGTTGSGALLWTQFYYDSGSAPTGSVTGSLGENHGTWYEATASNYANTGLGSNNAADDPTLTGITYSSATGRFTGFPQGVYQISFTGNAAIDAAGLTISTQKYVYLQGSGIYADFPINILPEAAYHNYPNFEAGFSVVTTAVMSNATAANNYLEVATSTQSSNFYGYYGYLSITKIG